MNSSKSLISLYNLLEQKFGQHHARVTIPNILSCAIGDLQDEGTVINEDTLNKKISEFLEDYQFALKSDVA